MIDPYKIDPDKDFFEEKTRVGALHVRDMILEREKRTLLEKYQAVQRLRNLEEEDERICNLPA